MDNANRLYFTKEQLADTPSRRCGIDQCKELSYRQQAANFVQDMGQRLQLSQLCINTAIVYMHRFYAFHSFKEVHRNQLSVSALFLAAKVEEQPRKLEHVIKVAYVCLHKDNTPLDVRSEAYVEKMFEVVAHENILLQTLGFVLAIEHPHTYVVKVCQLVKASKDLAQTSYIMATTSLHMTTMCLQYKPTVVACVCIHLACKWSSYMIEPCSEGRDWFYYVDRSVTWELLEKLTQEFIAILETSPHRFKRKFGKDAGGYHGPRSIMDSSQPGTSGTSNNNNGRPSTSSENKMGLARKDLSSPCPSTSLSFDFCVEFEEKTTRSLKYDSPEKRPSKYDSPEKRRSKYDSPEKLVRSLKYESPEKADHRPFRPFKVESPDRPVRPIKVESPERPARPTKAESPAKRIKVESPEMPPEPPPLPPPVSTALPPLPLLPPPPPLMLSPIKDIKPSIVAQPPQPRRPSPPVKDVIKTNGSKETDNVDKKLHAMIENNVASKRTLDAPSSKHERREKHKTKHSSHSKDRHTSNHSEHPPSIKVKIRRDIISLKPVESSQKHAPPIKPESPKKSIKIRIPKPPMPEPAKAPKPAIPTSLKLVLTKNKSGNFSTKGEHRESKKRSHGSAVAADGYKNSHEPSSKYSKVEHSSHRSHSGDLTGGTQRQAKVSRHSSAHGHPYHQSNLRQSLPMPHMAQPPLPSEPPLPTPLPPLPPPE